VPPSWWGDEALLLNPTTDLDLALSGSCEPRSDKIRNIMRGAKQNIVALIVFQDSSDILIALIAYD